MSVIDVHSHTLSASLYDWLRSVGRGSSEQALAAREFAEWPRVRDDPQMRGALDARLELLDEAGIDTQVLCAGIDPSTFSSDERAIAEACRQANDDMSAASQRTAGRYRFWATLPLPHAPASLDELQRVEKLPGYSGVTFPTRFGLALDDPRLNELYAALSLGRTLMFVHPNRRGEAGRYSRLGMETMLGWPADDTLAIMELILGGVLERFPGIIVVTPHLSGTILFLLGRIDRHYLNLPPSHRHCQELPSAYIKRMYHDSVSFLPPAMELARSIVGVGHLVLGSDFPWQSRERLGECVELVEQLPWNAQEKKLVLGGNMRLLLGERQLLGR